MFDFRYTFTTQNGVGGLGQGEGGSCDNGAILRSILLKAERQGASHTRTIKTVMYTLVHKHVNISSLQSMVQYTEY